MVIATGNAATAADVLTLRAGPACLFPQGYAAQDFGNNTWTGAANYTGGAYKFWETGDDGNYVEWKAFLSAGTYKMSFIYGKNTDAGILDIYIDAAEIGSVDSYNAGETYDNRYTVTGIVVATDGWKSIKVYVDGKNGASSNYYYYSQALLLQRTA